MERATSLTAPDEATAVILARLEGRLETVITELRGNQADQGRRIGATEQAIAAIDARCRIAETGLAVCQASIDEVRDTVRRAPSATRANVTLIIAGLSLLVAAAGIGNGGL